MPTPSRLYWHTVNSDIETIFANIHLTARLFVGLSLLLTVILNQEVTVAMLQLIISVTSIILQKQGKNRLKRAMGFLTWLLIPILLLHAFFTPGELIFSGMTLPVSFEGLKMGGWLALHLAVIFLSALLMFGLLSQKEWLRLAARIHVGGSDLIIYGALLDSGWRTTQEMIRAELADWRDRGQTVRGLISGMIKMPVKLFQSANSDARELWHDWDSRLEAVAGPDKASCCVSVFTTSIAILVGALLWTLYVAGI